MACVWSGFGCVVLGLLMLAGDSPRVWPAARASGAPPPCQALLAPPWQVAGLLPGEQAGLRHRELGRPAAGLALPTPQRPASGPPAARLFHGCLSCAVSLRDVPCSWPAPPVGAGLEAPCSGKGPDFTLFHPRASLSGPEPAPARQYHLGAMLSLAVQPRTWIDFEAGVPASV